MHLSAGVACLLGTAALSQAQLRVVQYNAGDVKTGTNTVLEQLGKEITNGISKPIDIFITEEVDNQASANAYATLLNNIYGANTYTAATVVGATGAGGQQVMIYRNASVQLIATKQVGTVSSSGAARTSPRYQVRPVGYGAASDFYIYASHPKANDDTDDANRRGVEAAELRADADALGANSKVMFVGDMNFYRSSEPGYKNFIAAGNAQAVDVLNTTGSSTFDWTGSGNKALHTQSPATTSAYSGQVLGGMNDRFDFQLPSKALADSKGVAYIAGSMHAFGNNGPHSYNGAITTGNYTNAGLSVSGSTVLTALAQASDHIPVVADYQLAAKMSASVASVPSTVIVGATVPVNVSVSNSAPVSFANGADKLGYAVAGTGSLSGLGSGTASALAAANVHTLTLDASSVGISSGTVSVTSGNQDLDVSTFTQAVSTSVIAHAKPSLATSATSLTSLTLDFGIRARGETTPTQSFSLSNVSGGSAQAGLDLDNVALTGGNAFATNAASFTNLAAGGSATFNASLSTANVGTFGGTISLSTSDQDFLGASSYAPLTINLTGIVALAGDTNLDGKVDIVDLGNLASHWQSTNEIWQDGDFNHDGKVDIVDLGTLSANWQGSAGSYQAALAAMNYSVPEPSLLGLGVAALILRRRRA